jgi:pimeloyl-ACP methyl ester carboxylesterase
VPFRLPVPVGTVARPADEGAVVTDTVPHEVLTLPDGRELAYVETGDPSGPPVLFFHGTPGSRGLGAFFGRDSGLRYISTDRPGLGFSSPVPRRRLLDWPLDVAALADHLGLQRFLVAGISGGGPHALACASALPERVVAAGSICGSGPLDSEAASEAMHAPNRALFDLARKDPDAVLAMLEQQYEQMKTLDRTQIVEMMRQTLPPADISVVERHPDLLDVLANDQDEAMRQGGTGLLAETLMFVQPWGFALEDIQVPVLLWQGDQDLNVPLAHAQEFERRIPRCTATYYPGEGHLLFLDHQAEIEADLLQAWKSTA